MLTKRYTAQFLVREKALTMAGNYIVWNGSKYYADPLARKIEDEGAWKGTRRPAAETL